MQRCEKVVYCVFFVHLLTDNTVTSIVKEITERLHNDSLDGPDSFETKCSADGNGVMKVIEEYKNVFGAQKIR